ncbi:hypothetical protein OVW19_30925, partial [Klebsiella pneumoniae]|uniref:hypothetical protein n=1 Tax=Klebsiella pneumoniae TaxID=573 RepID=UPI00226F1358
TLDLTVLGQDWYAHGKHEVTWDGRIAAAEQQMADRRDPLQHDLTKLTIDTKIAAFPDGYLTLEHTPYKVKLTLESQELKG